MAEKTFFDEGGVTVTQSRIIVHGDTYLLANITSCKTRSRVETDLKRPFLKKTLMIVGIIIGMGIGVLAKNLWVGLITAILAIIGTQFIKEKFKVYTIHIGSASGETEAFQSKNKHFVGRVVSAVNEAIVNRG